jgi:hypothetical protein
MVNGLVDKVAATTLSTNITGTYVFKCAEMDHEMVNGLVDKVAATTLSTNKEESIWVIKQSTTPPHPPVQG